jgi:IPT/TIG domain
MRSYNLKDSDVSTPCPQPAEAWSNVVRNRAWWVAVVSLVLWQIGCGDGTIRQRTPVTPGTPGTPSANISISPGSAMVGSPDLTLTIAGSNTFTFAQGGVHYSTVVWSQDGIDTGLLTTFVSSSQLTATVPAVLLASLVTATIHVEIWDRIEGTLVATSSSVPFQVTSTTTPTPSISSISPSTVAAGSADVTITIEGSNFGHYGHFIWSTAFWTTNGNLHDTGTWLQTTIVSSSQLTAVIPANLLQSPDSVQIVVMNGDVMGMSDGYFGYPKSNSVTLTVTP